MQILTNTYRRRAHAQTHTHTHTNTQKFIKTVLTAVKKIKQPAHTPGGPGRLRSWSGPVETDFQGRPKFSSDNRPGLHSPYLIALPLYTFLPASLPCRLGALRCACGLLPCHIHALMLVAALGLGSAFISCCSTWNQFRSKDCALERSFSVRRLCWFSGERTAKGFVE